MSEQEIDEAAAAGKGPDGHEAQVHVKSLVTGEAVHFKMPLTATVQSTWDQAYIELEEEHRAGETFRCADGTDLESHLGETLALLRDEHICEGFHFEIRGPSGGA